MHLLNTTAGCFCGFLYPAGQETHGRLFQQAATAHREAIAFTTGLEIMTLVERVQRGKGRE